MQRGGGRFPLSEHFMRCPWVRLGHLTAASRPLSARWSPTRRGCTGGAAPSADPSPANLHLPTDTHIARRPLLVDMDLMGGLLGVPGAMVRTRTQRFTSATGFRETHQMHA